jgi:dephospho-CoA kinase
MVHPHVMLELDQRVDALAREGKDVVFIESALIFEAAIDDFFDYVIAVVASDQTVIGRLTSSGRMNEDEARARISHQLPVEDKAGRADFTLRNDGTREELQSAVNLILSLIPSLCKMPVQ